MAPAHRKQSLEVALLSCTFKNHEHNCEHGRHGCQSRRWA